MSGEKPIGAPGIVANGTEGPRTLGTLIGRRVPWMAPAAPALMALLAALIGWLLFRRTPNVVHVVAVAVGGVAGGARGEKARREAREWKASAGETYETPADLTHEFADAMSRSYDPRADRTEWRYPRL